MNSLHSANGVAPPSRRASLANVSSPTRHRTARSPLRSLSPEVPPKPIPTAHSVASAHFKAELEVHHAPEPTRRAETVVILQDACYGHRFARPRASRSMLSTIFERPERIKACAVGVAAAYVRLGERHQEGAFPIYPDTNAASLPTIPFRIQRSTRRMSLSSAAVTNVHGTKWMEELKMMCDTAEVKLAGGGKELQRPDIDRGFDAEEPQKFHEGDLYLCDESLAALEGALGGVCDAVDAVFTTSGPQRAFAVIRPPGHHCSSSHPSGFCWLNNVHVGIMHGVLSHGLTHAAIIDFDLHHGDGSQSIAWQHNTRSVTAPKNAALWKKTAIGYFSLHDINSYPCEIGDEDKVRNASICIDGAHGQSIWNVHLQPWKSEAEFWTHYETKYSALLQKTRAFLKNHTEKLRAAGLNSRAAIFLSAGFDASQWEDSNMQRHNVNVPTDFYARFTRDVVRIAAEEGTSVEGRIISVLEGGYSDRALCSGVFSHLCGLAGDGPSNREQERPASRYDMSPRSTPPLRARKDSSASERGSRRYEPSWWSAAELERLEVTLATPPPVPKVPRNCTPPTYSSPTQASAARAVAPKNRRSMSGLSPVPSNNGERVFWEPPPPLDVSWTVAALELSKLLIPTGRQTNSYTHEELNAEATKARRERARLAPPAPPPVVEERPATRMGLRERKAKPAAVAENDKARRKTVAGLADLATEPASRGVTPVPGKTSRSSGRRLSVASTIVSSEGLDTVSPVPRPAPIRGSSRVDANIRPESSMSVATTNGNGLNVKKTRGPTRKEPVPRAPRVPRKNAANGATAQPSPTTNASFGASTAEKPGDEVDKLAGEMKKVRITVLTKAQKEARERERLAKEKLSKTKELPMPPPPEETTSTPQPTPPATTSTPLSVPPSSTSGTAIKQLPSPTPSPMQHHQQQPSPIPVTPSQELPPLASPPPTTSPLRVPLPPISSPPAVSSPVKDSSDIFIPYQPDGPAPVPVAVPQEQQQQLSPQQQQTLHWLPPNVSFPTASPSPAKSKADLPVFTSTSVIPFAPGPGLAGPGLMRGKSEDGTGEGQ